MWIAMYFQQESLIFECGARGVRKVVNGKNHVQIEFKFITFLKQYADFIQHAYFPEETQYVLEYV